MRKTDASNFRFLGFGLLRPANVLTSIERDLPLSFMRIVTGNFHAGYSERFVYSSVDNFDDARKMLSENHRLKAGPRYGRVGSASGAS